MFKTNKIRRWEIFGVFDNTDQKTFAEVPSRDGFYGKERVEDETEDKKPREIRGRVKSSGAKTL